VIENITFFYFKIHAAMNLLSVEQLSKSFGTKDLFKKISFGINYGEKVALIAKNGQGKSTLINILKGKEIQDEGTVTFKKDLKIGYLEQQPVFDTEKTIMDVLLSDSNEFSVAVKNYEIALQLHAENPDEKNSKLLDDAILKMSELDAWNFEANLSSIAAKLGLKNLNQRVGELSGGQIKRLALSCLLINEPDLLVLDEPTNHLDIEMIEWLQHHLSSYSKSILLITHDRYFLDEVCTQIIELEYGKLYHYKGNFQYYIEKKGERIAISESEIDKARNLYRRELEWIRKMPKARGTKSKSRIQSFYETEEKIKQNKTEQKIDLNVKTNRLGSKILELINISKSFGEKNIINHFSYTFKHGDKIGLVGKNGSGKSTLLSIIMNNLTFDQGKIQTGETVVFGYYSQMGMKIQEDKRVLEVVKDFGEFIPLDNGTTISASQLLTRFNFPPDVQYGFVSKLSGGEKRRLYLLIILITNPNFLILDEPTNDLDIETLQTLEDFLVEFKGCVLVVSHDRFFLDKIINQVFAFQPNAEIKQFPGNYTEYRNWLDEQLEIEKNKKENLVAEPEKVSIVQTDTSVKQSKKLSYKEQKELEQIEQEIEKLETEKKQFTDELSSGLLNHEDLIKKGNQLKLIQENLEIKSLRWLELLEKLEE
jgi:ATP-binding cassette subfamily F protein uup